MQFTVYFIQTIISKPLNNSCSAFIGALFTVSGIVMLTEWTRDSPSVNTQRVSAPLTAADATRSLQSQISGGAFSKTLERVRAASESAFVCASEPEWAVIHNAKNIT